jgi:type I restriction enzyme S subunit
MVENIPEGYKKTEVGVIPKDWEVKTCDQLGNFYKGKGISLNDVKADGYPCIMYGDIYVKFNTHF